ncbi:BRICHOS domain-containing protein 5 [Neosynchiropus ocellatus]
MGRCWNHSDSSLEDERVGSGGFCSAAYFPHKAFWVSLSASLLLVIITLSVTGQLGLKQPHTQSVQTLRVTVPDQAGVLLNQSATVDHHNNLVTFLVTSPANQTSTVVFDIKQRLICYKPVEQESCFLRQMEAADYEHVRSLLRTPSAMSHVELSSNLTQRQTEFLRVLAASQVDMSSLEEPLRVLCQNRTVHWTRRAEGPAKQRLVYFCIDICFPSNICVSVCFYYLPE